MLLYFIAWTNSLIHFILLGLYICSVVTKALDAETKTEAAGFETEAKTGSSFRDLGQNRGSTPQDRGRGTRQLADIINSAVKHTVLRKIKLNHRYMMFTCNAAVVRSLWA